MERLWREIKGRVPSNKPTPDLGASLRRVPDDLQGMTNWQRLQTAGVLSESLWLPPWSASIRGIGRRGVESGTPRGMRRPLRSPVSHHHR